jgi:hypothetical protein
MQKAIFLRHNFFLYFSDTTFFPVTRGVAFVVLGSHLLQGVQPMMVEVVVVVAVVVVGGITGGGAMFWATIEH